MERIDALAPMSGDRPMRPENVKGGPTEVGPPLEKSGDDLLSQGDSTQVPSAQSGLTSVFGMGTGVTQTR